MKGAAKRYVLNDYDGATDIIDVRRAKGEDARDNGYPVWVVTHRPHA